MPLPASRRATEQEWREAFLATRGATFVQSPEWYAVSGPLVKGYTAVAHVLDLPGGPAVVPLWERPVPIEGGPGGTKTGIGASIRRVFAGTASGRVDIQANARGLYAAWLRKTALDAEERRQVAEWLAARSRLMAWRANPFQEIPAAEWAEFGPVEPETTYLIGLTKGPEAIWAGFAGGMRADVNRTKRGGVACRPARGLEDWSAYVDLYETTLARWGTKATNRYSREFLMSLGRLDPMSCQLWVAELDGRMVAGIIHFHHGGHVLAWHLANDLGVAKLSPTKLLIHESILDAQRRGHTVYDLNVSGGHEGPEKWKQFMGAEPMPAPFIRRETAEMRAERLAKLAARRLDAEAMAGARAASGGGGGA
jgi:Acetyltransferase (GNAT) domain